MRNIIITGGELFNKGAQAMTFVTVSELKKRFPDHDIYLLSEMDRRRTVMEKAQYAFRFTGWYPIKFARCQNNPVLRMMCLLKNGKELRECEAIYRNCDLMVDISGYGLGSNWDLNQLKQYADHLEYAKAFHIPCYLMPQSFGPFDFDEKQKSVGDRLPDLLKNVKVICAREREGYDALLEKYNLENIRMMSDLVLNNKEINVNSIYTAVPDRNLPVIKENSIAVIPNEKVLQFMELDRVLSIYRALISKAVENGKHVYLLTHASPDRDFCKKISEMFINNESVIFMDRDFSCLEFNEMVKGFSFLIASRYHAIIHAFKNGVPCLSFGWADKYQVLMKSFGQCAYMFDIRDDPSIEALLSALDSLSDRSKIEKKIIIDKLVAYQENNDFDILC